MEIVSGEPLEITYKHKRGSRI